MRTFYTYESYAAWRKSTGGASTEPVKLVGSGVGTWPATYNAQAEIDRLTAERDNLIRGNHRQAICIHTCGAHIGPDTACTIEGLPKAVKHMVAERDQALARAAAAAMDMQERAATVSGPYMSDDVDELLLDMWREDIRTLPIDHDAQEALDKLLAKAREDAIREAAAACDWGDIYGDNAVRAILALLNDGGGDEN